MRADLKRAGKRLKQIEGTQWTRLAAIAALFISLLSAVPTWGLLYAVWDNETALRHGKAIPQLDEKFDTIAAASAVGRLDILSVLLAFLGIIAAVSLVYGWTAFRSTARQAAIAEVDEQLPEALAELLEVQGHSLVAKALNDDQLVARLQERFTKLGIDDTEVAIDVDSEPNWGTETGK